MGNPINQSMLVGDSSRPIPRKSVLKRLRLAEALIWVVTRNILNQWVNLLQDFSIARRDGISHANLTRIPVEWAGFCSDLDS
jgi:hypothetical protein